MNAKFNQSPVNKGTELYLLDAYNGFDPTRNTTIDFSIMKWTVFASGRKQTYLTSDAGNSKTCFSSDWALDFSLATTLEEAIAEAMVDARRMVAKELERAEFAVNQMQGRGYGKYYEADMNANLQHVKTAPLRLLVFDKWYTQGRSHIAQTIEFER